MTCGSASRAMRHVRSHIGWCTTLPSPALPYEDTSSLTVMPHDSAKVKYALGWGTMTQATRSRIPFPKTSLNPFLLILSYQKNYWPGVGSASNQKCSWGVKSDRRVRLTASPPSVSRLSRKCEIVNISQLYRSSRPVTWDSFTFFTCRWCSYLIGNMPIGYHGLLQIQLYFFIRKWCSYLTGNTTRAYKDCHGDSFTCL
jgi:hypothetical protein